MQCKENRANYSPLSEVFAAYQQISMPKNINRIKEVLYIVFTVNFFMA